MRRWIVVLLVCLPVVAASLWIASVRVDARYIARISSVEIPFFALRTNSIQLDWCLVAKYRLSKSALQQIATKHSFLPLAMIAKEHPLELDSLASTFEDRSRAFMDRPGLVAMRGRTKTNKWEFVADQDSGSLWVVVMFPDMAGHFPPS